MKRYSYEIKDLSGILPLRREDSHKGDYGRLLLAAGSRNMAGAAYFAAKAAYRSGAGLVYVYTPECNRVILQQLIPEAILLTYDEDRWDQAGFEAAAAGKDAVAVGPGLGKSDVAVKLVEEVLKQPQPKILDADALNILSEHPNFRENASPGIIVSPHVGEMSRLIGKTASDINRDRETAAVEYARKHQVITILKGSHTIVTNGEEIYINQSGNNGMSTAGSGDVLTGIIGGFLSQSLDPFEAAKAGVYVHGLAGDRVKEIRGTYSMIASDLIEAILYGVS